MGCENFPPESSEKRIGRGNDRWYTSIDLVHTSRLHAMIPANYPQQPGARLGSYEIVRVLGTGGMASVYEARDSDRGTRVAIKVLHEHVGRNAEAATRFLREARVASAIRHPHVVEVFEVGLHAGTPFLIMELLKGQNLATYLDARGRLSAAQAVDILLPIASAVAAAHAAGILHRDLKPTNLVLAGKTGTGVRAKVVDFGVSKDLWEEKERELTETATILGTLEYMAPEQVQSAKNATERSDQYALGVILYECLTGRRPFAGESRYDLLHAIVTAPFATPRAFGIDLDEGLESVILRAMNRDPAQRFPSVEAMGRSLLPWASKDLRALWEDDFLNGSDAGAQCAAAEAPLYSRIDEVAGEMAFRLIQVGNLDVQVWVGTAANPTRAKWSQACRAIAELVDARGGDATNHRAFIVTDGGAPNVMQRKELLRDALRGNVFKAVTVSTVLKTNPIKRGVATALHWLNPAALFLEPAEVRRAFDHLGVTPSQFSGVWDCLVELQRSLPPIETLRLIAHELRLPLDH